jgi:two-component system response regulator RstA
MSMPPPERPRVLVVEDDRELAQLTADRLQREGYEVAQVHDGLQAVSMITAGGFDAVVLDVMLPGIDGLDVCRRVRDRFAGAIVMVSARDEELDEIIGLELGADDYLTKPLSPRLLVARLKAVLRRRGAPAETETGRHVIGDLVVDEARREVLDGGRRVELTTAEFDVLAYLAQRPGLIVGREALYQDVLGVAWDGLDRTVDVYMSRIRHKLGDDPRTPERIKTVRGTGYLLARA